MEEKEVILLDAIPDEEYNRLVGSSVRYAVISSPFTTNRMDLVSIRQRILNIAKGKLAEALFWFFCKHNNIRPDFNSCATPFWQVDKKDFLLNGSEWDLKNNYVYHSAALYHKYTYLPALIPNRFEGDQWSKRSALTSAKAKDTKYLFTFLRNAGLTRFLEREKDFLELRLSEEQEHFLHALYSQFKGRQQRTEPFTKEWFWEQMHSKGPAEIFRLHAKPSLAITGYADKTTFNLFKDTGPGTAFNYQDHISPVWYTRSAKTGSVNFLNSTLWTTIKNATCPISELPSFLSLFPHLKEGIKYGTLSK